MHRLSSGLPFGWQIDLENLGNEHRKPKIQLWRNFIAIAWFYSD